MAFAASKSPEESKPAKRSPLAGWLGRKKDAKGKDVLPEVDIASGVDRALRKPVITAEAPSENEKENPVRDALGAIEAALYAIDRIRDTLEQACEVAISAKDIEDAGGRALLAEHYDELRLSVDYTIEQADPRAAILIGKSQRHLDVNLGGTTRYSVSPVRLDASERGLALSPPRDAFATYEEITQALDQLDHALARADRAAANYCRDAQYLIARMNGDAEG